MRVLLNGEQFAYTNNPNALDQIAQNSGVSIGELEIHPEDLAEYQQKQIDAARRAEYNRRGCTVEEMLAAIYDQDDAEIARIQAIRLEVKAAIPK